jgi:hypothetical protein
MGKTEFLEAEALNLKRTLPQWGAGRKLRETLKASE